MFCNYCGTSKAAMRKQLSSDYDRPLCKKCGKSKAAPRTVRFCGGCGELIPPKKPQTLINGEIVSLASNRRFCQTCQIKNLAKKPGMEKEFAVMYMNANRSEERIIFDCQHDIPGKAKDRHHYDYSLPNVVMLLCPACHGREHARLNGLAKGGHTKNMALPPPETGTGDEYREGL